MSNKPDKEYIDLLKQYRAMFGYMPFTTGQPDPPRWQLKWCIEHKKNIDQAPPTANQKAFARIMRDYGAKT